MRAPARGYPVRVAARTPFTLALIVAVAALLVAARPAPAAPDLAGDPLARATLLALPSVYRVDVTLRIPAIRTSNGQRIGLGHGGTVAERGTATAVAPDGWLVTAAHLVDPDPRTLARIGYQRWQAAQGVAVSDADAHAWAIDAGAKAVGARVLGIRVSQADPGTGFFETRRWTGVVERTAANADLSLIRIGAPGAPALPLEDAVSLGTPVVTIGYGRGSAWDKPNRSEGEPAVRRGRLERTGILSGPRRKATVVSTDIQRGDSGGPAVDAGGNVRGIVVLRGEGGGIIEQAAAVRRLLEEEGLDSRPGPAGTAYRRGMAAMWRLDLPAAQRQFAATLQTFPDHTLAHTEAMRVADLAVARYTLTSERRRNLLLAVGILAALAGLACAARLAWLSGAGVDRRV